MSSNTSNRELAVLLASDCQRNVKFVHELRIKGLVGIMADQREVSWIDLNETFVNVANSVNAGLENARQPWNRGMQVPPQNMMKEAQVSRPYASRVTSWLPSPAQHHDPHRFDVPQATARPRMQSPRVSCAPRVPNAPRMRQSQVKLQRLPGIVSAKLTAGVGAERLTSAPEDTLPKTSKYNGSDLSPKKMEKREESKNVKGNEEKPNGNENQKQSKEGDEKNSVKVKDLKSLKRANEEPFENPDESPEKNGAMKTGRKKMTKKNATEMPELIRETVYSALEDEPLLLGKGADEQGTRKTKPRPQAKRSKLEAEKEFISNFN